MDAACDQMAWVKCHCCDTPFYFPLKILQSMKLPSTFCKRCFELYDTLTLRKWFVLDMLCRQVQSMAKST